MLRTYFSPGTLGFPLLMAAVMLGLEIFDWLTPFYSLDRWGVVSWSLWHLPGIPAMPFLHGGFGHLFSNLLPFLILGVLLAARGQFSRVMLLGTLGTGALVWLWPFSGGIHIGASGIVLCFFGFLIIRGIRTRAWQDVLISIGVTLFYGLSMWATVTNFSAGTSWQGHLAGLIVGLILGSINPDQNHKTA